MQINRKTKITLTSKIMILLAKFGLPDASKLLLPRGHYVSNEEMYSLQQDRIDANPAAFHPKNVGNREVSKRNILVSWIRRRTWKRACRIGIIECALGIAFWGAINYGTQQIIKGVNHVEQSISDSNRSEDIKAASKQMTIDTIKRQVAQLKADCESGKKEVAACQAEMNVLKQQYEEANK
ncbi:hypothetical protein F7R25_03835 [Burkholderia stagnalis]|uniref:Uncharacterized protein n=1 Tax=Burkholderia stagnalis TaxID=1503054 RepID=A0A6L3N2X8_9BURK|nr:hypothetical protein [Burkholderia stagnalis]KAB0640635.1 hypothetical protein F7R25_03835 [Burkholderia stagnalis]